MKKQNNNFNLEDFKFIGSHLLVQAIKITENKEGVVKPKQEDDKPEFGKVLSVGFSANHQLNPEDHIKVGDTIIFGRYMTEETKIDGKKYYFLRAEDVKGFLKRNK